MRKVISFLIMMALLLSYSTFSFVGANGMSSPQSVSLDTYNNVDDVYLEEDLILHASFDLATFEGSKYIDLSGNANDGAVTGAVTPVAGQSGEAVLFNNDSAVAGKNEVEGSDYIDFGSIPFGTGDFSIAMWVKAPNNSSNNTAILSNKDFCSGANAGFSVANFKKDIRVNMNTAGKTRADITDLSGNDNQWHHIAVVFDRSANKLIGYRDAKLIQTIDISAHKGNTLDTAYNLVLGAGGSYENSAAGIAVDELRIYNKAIVENKVLAAFYTDGGWEIDLNKAFDSVSGPDAEVEFTASAINDIKADFIAQLESQDLSINEIITKMRELQKIVAQMLKDTPNMTMFLTSDIHADDSDGDKNLNYFIAGMKDMKAIDSNAAAYLPGGDFTEDGRAIELTKFYNALELHNPVPNNGLIMNLGNHDVRGFSNWGSTPDNDTGYWSTFYPLFMSHNQPYMPNTDGKVYFDRWVGATGTDEGYHIISMNTETSIKDHAYISDAQIAWLDAKLAEGNDPQRPKFVSLHQPLLDTCWRSNFWGVGAQDAKIKAVLAKYPNVIYISGHIHNGFGVAEAVDREFGTTLDLPAFKGSENGYKTAGAGYYVKVYSDRVVFKARNFVSSAWLPQYDIIWETPNMPYVYKLATAKVEADYTPQSYAALAAAIAKAEAVFNTKYTLAADTQSTPASTTLKFGLEGRNNIDQVKRELVSAINGLVRAA